MSLPSLSDFHQQLIQSWATKQPIARQWYPVGQSSTRKPIAASQVVPVAIAWSLFKP